MEQWRKSETPNTDREGEWGGGGNNKQNNSSSHLQDVCKVDATGEGHANEEGDQDDGNGHHGHGDAEEDLLQVPAALDRGHQ